jgi:hypothetical protein
MASNKTLLAENVQNFLYQSDWNTAIAKMEKLFALDGKAGSTNRKADIGWQCFSTWGMSRTFEAVS